MSSTKNNPRLRTREGHDEDGALLLGANELESDEQVDEEVIDLESDEEEHLDEEVDEVGAPSAATLRKGASCKGRKTAEELESDDEIVGASSAATVRKSAKKGLKNAKERTEGRKGAGGRPLKYGDKPLTAAERMQQTRARRALQQAEDNALKKLARDPSPANVTAVLKLRQQLMEKEQQQDERIAQKRCKANDSLADKQIKGINKTQQQTLRAIDKAQTKAFREMDKITNKMLARSNRTIDDLQNKANARSASYTALESDVLAAACGRPTPPTDSVPLQRGKTSSKSQSNRTQKMKRGGKEFTGLQTALEATQLELVYAFKSPSETNDLGNWKFGLVDCIMTIVAAWTARYPKQKGCTVHLVVYHQSDIESEATIPCLLVYATAKRLMEPSKIVCTGAAATISKASLQWQNIINTNGITVKMLVSKGRQSKRAIGNMTDEEKRLRTHGCLSDENFDLPNTLSLLAYPLNDSIRDYVQNPTNHCLEKLGGIKVCGVLPFKQPPLGKDDGSPPSESDSEGEHEHEQRKCDDLWETVTNKSDKTGEDENGVTDKEDTNEDEPLCINWDSDDDYPNVMDMPPLAVEPNVEKPKEAGPKLVDSIPHALTRKPVETIVEESEETGPEFASTPPYNVAHKPVETIVEESEETGPEFASTPPYNVAHKTDVVSDGERLKASMNPLVMNCFEPSVEESKEADPNFMDSPPHGLARKPDMGSNNEQLQASAKPLVLNDGEPNVEKANTKVIDTPPRIIKSEKDTVWLDDAPVGDDGEDEGPHPLCGEDEGPLLLCNDDDEEGLPGYDDDDDDDEETATAVGESNNESPARDLVAQPFLSEESLCLADFAFMIRPFAFTAASSESIRIGTQQVENKTQKQVAVVVWLHPEYNGAARVGDWVASKNEDGLYDLTDSKSIETKIKSLSDSADGSLDLAFVGKGDPTSCPRLKEYTKNLGLAKEVLLDMTNWPLPGAFLEGEQCPVKMGTTKRKRAASTFLSHPQAKRVKVKQTHEEGVFFKPVNVDVDPQWFLKVQQTFTGAFSKHVKVEPKVEPKWFLCDPPSSKEHIEEGVISGKNGHDVLGKENEPPASTEQNQEGVISGNKRQSVLGKENEPQGAVTSGPSGRHGRHRRSISWGGESVAYFNKTSPITHLYNDQGDSKSS